jgi:hypothetical protein
MAMIDEELGVMALPSPANPMNRDAELAGQDLENLGKDVLTKVQETYDLVKPEVETITAGVLSSGKRLDKKPRVFAAVPNSLLVYGGIAVVLYLVFKK